jgi:hypothetical protein
MKTNKKIVIIATSVILAIFLVATIIEQGVAMTLDSELTFGGGAGDVAQAIALWGTKKVIVGYTHSFGAGGLDAFIAVNDTTLKMWTFGTPRDELAFAVAIHDNYAYIVGAIDYAVPPNLNYFDIFVAKWNLMLETLVGFTVIGWNEHPFADAAFAVAADDTYVFVTGRWADDKSFLAILDADTLNVVKMLRLDLGPGNEFAYAIDFTTGISGYYIIVGGATNDPLGFGDYDAFLARIVVSWDASAVDLQWALRFGTADPDGVTSIKFVSYETFAVGGTLGGNGFIGYFTIDGGFLKARATVFSSTSIITSLAWNDTHLAAAGYFNNPPNLDDAYILLIDENGLLVDATGYGGGHIDRAHGVALDSSNVHVAGITYTFPNNVFAPPFTYEEVQVILTSFTPTITPYMKTEDITDSLSLNELTLGPDFNVNTIFITVLPIHIISTLTFNSPVNGDVFIVRFTT